MTQMSPMEPYEQNSDAVADYRQQSREFLNKSREYLAAGDWHQASEKRLGSRRLDGQSRCRGSRLALRKARRVFSP